LGKKFVSLVGVGTVAIAFLCSAAAVYELANGLPGYQGLESSGLRVNLEAGRADLTVAEWFPGGSDGGGAKSLSVPWLLTLDHLSAVMLLVVTGVGFLIHLYSTAYMAEDPAYWRFFAYLNLFMASMLTLVLGGAFPVMFVGWEGVGLCSYLLIGFWYDGESNAQAGRKAFITNRIGDAGFILGVLTLWNAFGTMEISGVMEAIKSGHAGVSVGLLTASAILLFVGACGKSAQVPLYVWLPDAMAGPTPVSALIHAATMVTAGVYMVCRCSVLFSASETAMLVVATVGGVTALFAATIGLAQDDIKKVLAYSTVSQLGYMFLGAGMGSFTGAIFHVTTHAFFKALMFLGSGAVIHALHHEQDMRKMGGLSKKLPWTYGSFLMGWLAICGMPVFSGFFSKDEILGAAYEHNKVLWVMGLAGAALTALYMTRLMGLTFWGESRVDHHTEAPIHEVPWAMKYVLVTLAVLSVAGGLLGIPGHHFLARWLAPSFGHVAESAAAGEHSAVAEGAAGAAWGGLEWALAGVSVTMGLIGIAAGMYFYYRGKGERADEVVDRAAPLYRLLRGKWYVDELYDATVLRAYYATCRVFDLFDKHVVDGVVNRSGDFVEASAGFLKLFQTGLVRNYALFFLLGAAAVLWVFFR
ncbi:MAG: NADH-quinone oxidoreductase subunit L, partial [Acidobacteria bacterium]|nr:NADH-quinone oxidoreductase subunit L [Acidobacteriota bacterium]